MLSTSKINFIVIKVLIAFYLTFNVLADKNEAFMGNTDAKNVLIEYASLSCVHCANFHTKQLPSIKKELIDTGKLKYIYRDFPLDKPAMIASMVSNCYKGEQYFTVLNTLFRNQKKWVVKSENLEVALHSILKVHGISIEDINDCTIENAINKDLAVAPGMYLHLGHLFYKVGDFKSAKASFEAEKKLFPESAYFSNKLIEQLNNQ